MNNDFHHSVTCPANFDEDDSRCDCQWPPLGTRPLKVKDVGAKPDVVKFPTLANALRRATKKGSST